MLEESLRRPRADAERNRQKLLDAASALIKQGKGELSLAAVAHEADVGIGTLYRNFHDRDALLAALYRSEVERLHDAAEMLAKDMPPLEALRAWLGLYADLMTVKYGLADAMKSALKSDAQIFTHSRSRLAAALSALLSTAAEAGVIRRDAEAEDLLIAVAAQVSASIGGAGAGERRARLLGLMVDGLRFGAAATGRG
ncbi:MAG: TetR family transcriptional regulator [Hyphomicrobiales bacterium]|nr:TetR family transcriptional regulator [Hyphomicrobiales bacterium]